MSEPIRTVRATFVFTDIEGSTRLLRELGDDFVDVLEDHRRYIRSEISSHGGREVGTDGDSFFVVFDDATTALKAVAEMQRSLSKHNWPAPLAIRVGLHTGEAIEVDGDFVGLDIHVTARVAAAGHGGQIVCTEDTYAAAGAPPPQTSWSDLGEYWLKDIPGATPLYQLAVDGLRTDFPPLRAAATQAALLDGCRVVIAEDMALLRAGVVRLLQEAGCEVVGQAGDADELLELVAREAPDLALIDIKMPPTHTEEGLVAAATIQERHPGTAVLLLSSYLDARFASALLEKNPARSGYLLKDTMTDSDVLVVAMRRVLDGDCVIDPAIVAKLLEKPRADDPIGRLTAREREILGLMAEGQSNRAIGELLFVSQRTVETHVGSVFAKLDLAETTDASRRVQAVLAYLRA